MELKDYLHFYLGCEVIGNYDGPRKGYLTGITNGGTEAEIQFFEEDGINVFEHPEFNTLDEIKPILRPLSDMTEEEAIEVTKPVVVYGDLPNVRKYETWVNPFGKIVVSWGNGLREKYVPQDEKCFTTEQFAFLLKKWFDLFELIDAGLAIDSTKQ